MTPVQIPSINVTNRHTGLLQVGNGLNWSVFKDSMIKDTIVAIDAKRNKRLDLKNVKAESGPLQDKIWEYILLRAGYSNQPENANGLITIDSCEGIGNELPSSLYSQKNKDVLSIEIGSPTMPNIVWAKKSKFKNGTDSIMDIKAKGTHIFVDCDFERAYRMVRVREGVEVVFINCRFTVTDNNKIFQFETPGGKIVISGFLNKFNGQENIQTSWIDSSNADGIIQYVDFYELPQDPDGHFFDEYIHTTPEPVPTPQPSTLAQLISMQEKRVAYEAELLKTLREL